MAIDTVQKRFAMMHTFGGFCPLPVPTGTIGAGPRYIFMGLYSGIVDSESGGGGGEPGAGIIMMTGHGR